MGGNQHWDSNHQTGIIFVSISDEWGWLSGNLQETALLRLSLPAHFKGRCNDGIDSLQIPIALPHVWGNDIGSLKTPVYYV